MKNLYFEKSADSLSQMRLINTYTLQPCEFTVSLPPYATFSHVIDEIGAPFEDFAHIKRELCCDIFKILVRACVQARDAGFAWLWNYAACVDRNSCAAQSEAINSLAQIYRNCGRSIIYLGDLNSKLVEDEEVVERIAECRWMRNIWAIPQIIFSGAAYFYSSDWSLIGTKASLISHLSSIMGIDEPVLEDSNLLEEYSLARRMSWASEMTASRVEDFAYALVGLFDVSMSILYGDGQKAFLKLQEEIMRDTDDFSLMAWDKIDAQAYNGLFAHSPACFRRFRNGPTTPLRVNGEVQIQCKGITIQTSFWRTETGFFLPLESQDGSTCSIDLVYWNGSFVRKGSQLYWDLPEPKNHEERKICVRRDVTAHVSGKISGFEAMIPERPKPAFEQRHEPVTAKASRCSKLDYNSIDETGSMETSVEDNTSRCAPSILSSELTSHEDHIAWSTHERRSVEGTSSALDSDLRPSGVHETMSDFHRAPEDCPNYAMGRNWFHSPCTEISDEGFDDGSQDSINENGTPSTEAQVLDVASIAKDLADEAAEEFLSGHQRQSRKRTLNPWQSRDRKRPKLMETPDLPELVHTSDSDDGETVIVNKARFFACPFYIQNNKFTKCVTRNHFQSVEDVKEHVCWEHRRPAFCPVCKEVFSSGRDRDAHIRLRTCHANNSPTPEGISDYQEAQLERERSPLSEELRWLQIWSIIFPRVEPPSSAFYTGDREVSVCAFRSFWMQRGEEIVAAFLEKKDCQSYNIKNEERELRAIYDLVMEIVVDKIFDDLNDTRGKA